MHAPTHTHAHCCTNQTHIVVGLQLLYVGALRVCLRLLGGEKGDSQFEETYLC